MNIQPLTAFASAASLLVPASPATADIVAGIDTISSVEGTSSTRFYGSQRARSCYEIRNFGSDKVRINVYYPGGSQTRSAKRKRSGVYFSGASSVKRGGDRYRFRRSTLTITYAFGEGSDRLARSGNCRP